MSVPVFRRSENKLQAYKSTIEMTKYTMHMVENEKIFPKKSRWNIGSRITDNCLDSIIKIRQANKIQVKTIEQAKFRLKLQQDVLLHFDALWSLMTIAYETYSIPSEKIEYWSNLLLTAENQVAAWRNHDRKCYKAEYNF